MTRHIIIGSSAVGISAIRKLRSLDAQAEIVCISDEQEQPYNKCFLADYVGQKKTEEQVFTLKPDYCTANNITTLFGTRVERIVPSEKKIIISSASSSQQELSYDTLLIGTGVSPLVPPIEGIKDGNGVFMFHRLRDAHGIMAYICNNAVKKAVVIGAGLSGLEVADALTTHGIQVAVVERAQQVLFRQVDSTAHHAIVAKMAACGVTWHPGCQVKKIVSTDVGVTGVELEGGEFLETQMVIVATGSRPNSDLAVEAGIKVQDGAIITDEHMMTSIPGIYAAGDVALVRDQLTGKMVRSCTWPDAMMQGMVAAQAMVGAPQAYKGVIMVVSSAFFGIKFASCGPIVEALTYEVPKNFEVILQESPEQYQALLVQNNVLRGFLLVGNTKKLPLFKRAVMTQEAIVLEEVLD